MTAPISPTQQVLQKKKLTAATISQVVPSFLRSSGERCGGPPNIATPAGGMGAPSPGPPGAPEPPGPPYPGGGEGPPGGEPPPKPPGGPYPPGGGPPAP